MFNFLSKNEKYFGNPDSFGWGRNNEGCYFLEGYVRPPDYEKFIDEFSLCDIDELNWFARSIVKGII